MHPSDTSVAQQLGEQSSTAHLQISCIGGGNCSPRDHYASTGRFWELPDDIKELEPDREFWSDTRGIGYSDFNEGREWFVRRLVWTKSLEGSWHGEWSWMDYDRCWNWWWNFDYDVLLRMIATSAGRHLPPEILLRIAEVAKESYSWHTRHDFATISLVCRTWRAACVALLCRHVKVDPGVAAEMGVSLRSSPIREPFVSCVTTLHVQGRQSWKACISLARFLPQVTELICDNATSFGTGTSQASFSQYHPSQMALAACASTRLGNVTSICLADCQLFSSRDLLNLLGSFPSLEKARLYNPTCAKPSHMVPLKQSSRLCEVLCSGPDIEDCWPLSLYWTWPHASSCSQASGFPGLPFAEAAMMVSMIRCISSGPFGAGIRQCAFTLQQCCNLPLWIAVATLDHITIEWYISAPVLSNVDITSSRPVSSAASVYAVLLRIRLSRIVAVSKDQFIDLDECLSRLPHLDEVLLEEPDYAFLPSVTELDPVRWLPLVHEKVRFRTAEEAYGIGLDARKGLLPNCARPIISPFWLSDDMQHKEERIQRLSSSPGTSYPHPDSPAPME